MNLIGFYNLQLGNVSGITQHGMWRC